MVGVLSMTAKSSQSYFINKQKSVFINICRFGIASRQQESGVDLLGHWPIDERSFSISFQGSPKNWGGEKSSGQRKKTTVPIWNHC